ncbi:PREDICTED: YY1-associated factor 2 [Bactrocera latifrons]|uniref:YY1-associated factor 2 n=2 Tax=Dacini TaxID=43871 RepID=A0A0K8VWA1_BACLA|nr:YY1-associated factor 2 [Zeugodacus cucurbitae]XP_014087248.1 YY1-associated factor 2 [Bactrocera oleae]XP_018802247.1 PREDICTED: YY1-associated factor 2 [Bactrocera latifrons]XP_039954851.1 YY1-associated factor 2 [Bactrocera tryoni]XP_039954852.1 YY1-associated factor 2 [Bactrocera tryoni]XP_050323405.1 YY1-associated factor 2 isoform X1 [Bactrocera neohumeralis]
MDHKKSPVRRQKRQSKAIEENFWDCSVCTYRNTAEAFKCRMCDVRKGTSTRKPRLNSALVAQQAATLPGASGTMPNGTKSASGSRHGAGHDKNKHKKYPARLKNVDRSTAQTREVTVNSVTVFITEYKPKPVGSRRESSEQSFSESNDSRS